MGRYARNVISPTGRPWLDELACAAEQFAAIIAAAEHEDALTTPVASCPGWDLRELALHLGNTHLWAAGIIGGADPRQRPDEQPADGAALADWYHQQAENLRKALVEAGPHKPCWTLIKEQRTALFWQRRQLHETLVHLWDARSALGAGTEPEVSPIDSALAFDGVAEAAEVMYPRMLRADRVQPLPKSLELTATDLNLGPVIFGDAAEILQVRGPAEELFLLVWQRIPWDPSYGDAEAADLLNRSLVP